MYDWFCVTPHCCTMQLNKFTVYFLIGFDMTLLIEGKGSIDGFTSITTVTITVLTSFMFCNYYIQQHSVLSSLSWLKYVCKWWKWWLAALVTAMCEVVKDRCNLCQRQFQVNNIKRRYTQTACNLSFTALISMLLYIIWIIILTVCSNSITIICCFGSKSTIIPLRYTLLPRYDKKKVEWTIEQGRISIRLILFSFNCTDLWRE